MPTLPQTIDEALEKDWLSAALAPVSGGSPVAAVELVNLITKFASMARIAVRFASEPERVHAFCLKSFFGYEHDPITLREADFYAQVAPKTTMRVPRFANAVIDRNSETCILIMEDVIAGGARFRSVLDPFTVDEVAQGLDELARLHAGAPSPDNFPWLPSRIHEIRPGGWLSIEDTQDKLDDPRGDTLQPRTRDAARLFAGIARMAEESTPPLQTVLHGDCHPGNVYMTKEGPGFADWQLVQRGHWSYDVAYHLNASLPVEVAEREERALLDHYLDAVRRHGGEPSDRESAWSLYRRAPIYGFFHWAIARSVGPELRNPTTARLGAAVERHDSYRLLGL